MLFSRTGWFHGYPWFLSVLVRHWRILVGSDNKIPILLPTSLIQQYSLSTYYVTAQTPTMCHDKPRGSWLQFLISRKHVTNDLYSFSVSSLQKVFFPLKAPSLYTNLGAWGQLGKHLTFPLPNWRCLPTLKDSATEYFKTETVSEFPWKKGSKLFCSFSKP